MNSFEGVTDLSTYTKHLLQYLVGGTEVVKQHGDTHSSHFAPIYLTEVSVYPKLASSLNHFQEKKIFVTPVTSAILPELC